MSSFGVCILDAPTGKFELAAFDDDACFTRLETLMRQLKPKEIIHAKVRMRMFAGERSALYRQR